MDDHNHESGECAVCNGGREAFMEGVRANVERAGRSILGVPDAGFAYTIGNPLSGKPELLITLPIDPRAQAGILNNLSDRPAEELVDGAVIKLSEDSEYGVLLAKPFEPFVRDEYTVQAGQFLGREDYPVLQVLVPDTEGRYPGEPGCAQPYADYGLLLEN